MKKSKELKDNQVRIAYKSEIKLSNDDKIMINSNIFIVNQLYNFLIETLQSPSIQSKLISLEYAKFIDFEVKNIDKSISIEQRLVITSFSKVRDFISPLFKEYMEERRLSIKGLSKPIQLKIEAFLENFNNINLSPIKSHNFKLSSDINQGSYETDSSLKLFKKKLRKQNGKRFTKYFVKIGRNLFELKNKSFNIKHFELKKVTISRKNGKYYVSLSGIKSIQSPKINALKQVGIDVNFETINLSDGTVYKTYNLQNKLNLYTNKLKELEQKRSERVELNMDILRILCKTDEIVMYNPKNPKKLSKEAKQLYKTILSSDKIYLKLNLKINKLFAKRTNIQNDFYNKIIKKITTRYDLFFIEKLNIENMINKEVSNQNLYNASLSKFLIMLKNKVNLLGKVYQEVESFNTSKCCHKCKKINSHITFKDKEWKCENCGEIHNRDYNASINIQELGNNLLIQGAELKSI